MYEKKWFLRLDTKKQYDNEVITMVRQDTYSNVLYIVLYNDSIKMEVSKTTIATVIIDKPDNTQVIGSAEVLDNGTLKYVVDYQALAALGMAKFTVKLIIEDNILTTTSFVVNVINDPFADSDGSIESTSEYPILSNLVLGTSNIIATEETRVENETHRKKNEDIRIDNENERIANENIRKSNEITRQSNETTRQNNETNRNTKETERQTNETTRQNNEATRLLNEDTRLSNETARQNNETSRVNAENARKVFEEFSSSKTYVVGNKVSYLGSSYYCIQNCTNILPTNTDYWLLIAKKGEGIIDVVDNGNGTITIYYQSGSTVVSNISIILEDNLTSTSTTRGLAANQGRVLNEIKVDKVAGKGLSENDYTTTEKNKLANIEPNAQVNKIEVVKRNGSALPINNKEVDITVPTVIDNLTSIDTDNALSANQGKILNDNMNTHKSNINHSFYGIASGTNSYTVTISDITSLVDGINVRIKFTNANTGACTLTINSLGAKGIKKSDGTDLASGDILAGQIVNLSYNGSVFQLISGGSDYVQIEFNNFAVRSGEIVRSTPTSLSQARYYLAGASIGDYALFAGGKDGTTNHNVVDAYTSSLVRSTPTALSVTRRVLAGASVGDYALFAGGWNGTTYYNVVDAYNSSLTRTTPTGLSQARWYLAGASIGDYAIFAGGNTGSASNVVDAYTSSLVRSTPTALSQARWYLAGASIGDYAIFAGGYTGSASNVVDAYNSSLTRTTPTPLSVSRLDLAGASVGDYALFAGGWNYTTYYNVVDAYNSSLTRTTPTGLSQARSNLAGASIGDYALFAGGYTGSASNVVDAYNSSLTRTTPTPLSVSRLDLAGASVGDYALFAGGWNGTTYYNVVDAYSQAFGDIDIPITSGSKYKLNSDTEVTATTSGVITVNTPLTGYIKYKEGVL
jgi:hypothetical protein